MVLNADDPLVAAMASGGDEGDGDGDETETAAAGRRAARVVTFSVERADADYSLQRDGTKVLLARRGEALLDASRMKIAGLHNSANALAALALGDAVDSHAKCSRHSSPFPACRIAPRGSPMSRGALRDDSKGTNVGATIAR